MHTNNKNAQLLNTYMEFGNNMYLFAIGHWEQYVPNG